MNIPKRFKLAGMTFEVKFVNNLRSEHAKIGTMLRDSQLIKLQSPLDDGSFTQTSTEVTFIHEVVHTILSMTPEDDYDPPLHRRECLVERISYLLHQFLTTQEFEKGDTEDGKTAE